MNEQHDSFMWGKRLLLLYPQLIFPISLRLGWLRKGSPSFSRSFLPLGSSKKDTQVSLTATGPYVLWEFKHVRFNLGKGIALQVSLSH